MGQTVIMEDARQHQEHITMFLAEKAMSANTAAANSWDVGFKANTGIQLSVAPLTAPSRTRRSSFPSTKTTNSLTARSTIRWIQAERWRDWYPYPGQREGSTLQHGSRPDPRARLTSNRRNLVVCAHCESFGHVEEKVRMLVLREKISMGI